MTWIDNSEEVTKCRLSPDELDLLERAAGEDGWQREIAVRLMGRCGLRASEVISSSDNALRYSEEGEPWLFEIRGNHTKGGVKKARDAWMPEDADDDIHKFSWKWGLEPSDA